ncbi:MAG: MBL fold metallo-hydrolase [Gammaproteobacteria bacterium]
MSRTFTRRTLIKGAFAAVAAGRFAPHARAADLPQNFTVFSGTGPNVLLMKTGDGAILVDSGAEAGGSRLLEQLHAFAPDGAYTLFNTHWHDEQVGGNEALGNLGATIVGHEKTKLHLSTPVWQPESESYKPALPPAARTTRSFYTQDSLQAGSETIDAGYLPLAHTDGDIYVFFREANVLAVGDVVSPARDPGLDWFASGWLGGRVDALDQVLSLADADTVIVPAFGPLVSKAEVQAERDLMQFLYDKLVDQIRMGFTPQDSLDSGLMDELPRAFDEPYKFLYDAHKGLWAHHNKLAPNIV